MQRAKGVAPPGWAIEDPPLSIVMPLTEATYQPPLGSLSESPDGSVACLGLRCVQIAAQNDRYVIGQPAEALIYRLKREQLRLIRVVDIWSMQSDDAQSLVPLGYLDLDHQRSVRPW